MIGLSVITLTLGLLIQNTQAHSWVECSSYDPVSFDYTTLGNYDRARCMGYPRGFQSQFNAGFGVDTGYNWQLPNCNRDPFKQSDYTSQIPMATYKPGQVIYISHPAKNHVADVCTNPFIPSITFYVNMSSKPDVDTFDITLPMVGADHVNGVIDHLGYQRCFDFCNNEDKSHCLSAWTLPSNIQTGRYSFIWIWQLNPNEFFSNCFDAYITSSGSQSVEILSNSSSSSGINDTIQFPSLPPSKTPTPTSMKTPSSKTSKPSPTPTSMKTPTPSPTRSPTPSPTPTPTPTSTPSPTPTSTKAQVITSNAPSATLSPFASITSYIITGFLNITGALNITQH